MLLAAYLTRRISELTGEKASTLSNRDFRASVPDDLIQHSQSKRDMQHTMESFRPAVIFIVGGK